jgi:hypothetical protein
MAYSKQ